MIHTQYAKVLNALDEMQHSLAYAARRSDLAEAERLILTLEHALKSKTMGERGVSRRQFLKLSERSVRIPDLADKIFHLSLLQFIQRYGVI